MNKKKKHGLSLIQKRNFKGFLFILPWLIGFIAFYARGLIQNIQFSLSTLTVPATGGYTLDWVGFDNYVYAFRVHGSFKQVLTSSLGNMLIDVPLIIFFSLFMAILLNKKFKGRGIVRAIFFIPVIMGAGAITDALDLARTMMSDGINSSSGEMSEAAEAASVSIEYFIELFKSLSLPEKLLDYVVGAVSRVTEIISASGVQLIIFIAALQSIPGSMYEVAKIEGATAYETFWKVTFPMVMPHIITNFVYTVVDKFADSEIIELAYTTTFDNFDYGLGSAMSMVSTVIVCVVLFLVVAFIQKRTFYYN
ncbi:MAG: sugar ABC transporter permease [Butyrivibrio sp.]|nr:sugar ABC transporter permease [Butyrivibrio sp.]